MTTLDKNKRYTGKVKFFNQEKGFGFIAPDDGGSDVFIHITTLQDAHYESLDAGDKVEYSLRETKSGKIAADKIKILN